MCGCGCGCRWVGGVNVCLLSDITIERERHIYIKTAHNPSLLREKNTQALSEEWQYAGDFAWLGLTPTQFKQANKVDEIAAIVSKAESVFWTSVINRSVRILVLDYLSFSFCCESGGCVRAEHMRKKAREEREKRRRKGRKGRTEGKERREREGKERREREREGR